MRWHGRTGCECLHARSIALAPFAPGIREIREQDRLQKLPETSSQIVVTLPAFRLTRQISSLDHANPVLYHACFDNDQSASIHELCRTIRFGARSFSMVIRHCKKSVLSPECGLLHWAYPPNETCFMTIPLMAADKDRSRHRDGS